MKAIHVPEINGRYWSAITLASVCGTNLGDFYAHEAGLGIVTGLGVLFSIAAAAFTAEKIDKSAHEFYYWFVIIIIRTGATNIADYLAFRLRVPATALIFGLTLLLAGFAWLSSRHSTGFSPPAKSRDSLPVTNAAYWAAMLSAGVLGTAMGDICSHLVGQALASVGLGLALVLILSVQRRGDLSGGLYWATVAIARTAGTAIGDWLAENNVMNLGLALSTSLTTVTFIAVLTLWRKRPVQNLEVR